MKTLPDGQSDAPVPSTEWIRLQFVPRNPYVPAAARYTGRFNMQFKIQVRQIRAQTQDAKFANFQYRLFKNFAVHYKEHVTLAYVDDKAIIPVGEPDGPLSTGVSCAQCILNISRISFGSFGS